MNRVPGRTGLTPAPGERTSGRDETRRALRRFASGVTVLTVSDGTVRHGTTVSALVAISREPLVLGVCLRSPSTFTALARKAGVFSVNVLSSQQALLARKFGSSERHGEDQFAGVEWTVDPDTGAPLIAGSLARLACNLTSCQLIGDHHLLTAEVLSGEASDGVPLLTFAGGLRDEGLADLSTTSM
ncbi:flavin reductase family protein [Streptomyces sp. NPDC019990]|uniref:flavin reductase family protein n=1 Tax=Streptomyces sp. NPDC019990 TaxID=3154693 RepID=UPI003404D5A5